MEIIAGESSYYKLLAFISLKMELHWRGCPLGRGRQVLPFIRNISHKKVDTTSFPGRNSGTSFYNNSGPGKLQDMLQLDNNGILFATFPMS
jgi:hypothetical protein